MAIMMFAFLNFIALYNLKDQIQDERDTSNIITPHMNIPVSNTDFINAARSSVGDICAADWKMSNIQIIL